MYIYIYIYIYICARSERARLARRFAARAPPVRSSRPTSNLPTNIVDFRGFDSSIILISRGGISRPVGNFPESLSRAMLVGTMLLGRLGVS